MLVSALLCFVVGISHFQSMMANHDNKTKNKVILKDWENTEIKNLVNLRINDKKGEYGHNSVTRYKDTSSILDDGLLQSNSRNRYKRKISHYIKVNYIF